MQEKAHTLVREQTTEGRKRERERKRQAMEAQIAALRAEFEVEQAEATKTMGQDQTRAGVLAGDRVQMARLRQGDSASAGKTSKRK
jgi:circadian clock protein KaiC